ncbi:transposase [Trinickia acidisoli]|uniref:transposase n=1 Tax=Trinickia acidisoli TaxID=2767482 RepID=UPI001A8E08BC|nr:transposase [Trinickia acidisoli]
MDHHRFSAAGHHEACLIRLSPNHCRCSVIGALDFGKNTLIHAAHTGTIKAPDVEHFIDSVLASENGLPTVIVLDNASIHHAISEVTRQRWLLEHKVILFTCLPIVPNST